MRHTCRMKNKLKSPLTQCVFCGRFFRPDARVGSRQKSCSSSECQKKRKRFQEGIWRKRNPDYFKGRYGYLKEWRERNPDYPNRLRAKKQDLIQTQIPPVSPIKSMRIHLRTPLRFDVIQTQILSVTLAGQSLWIDGPPMQGP